jgi:hypothetical protein
LRHPATVSQLYTGTQMADKRAETAAEALRQPPGSYRLVESTVAGRRTARVVYRPLGSGASDRRATRDFNRLSSVTKKSVRLLLGGYDAGVTPEQLQQRHVYLVHASDALITRDDGPALLVALEEEMAWLLEQVGTTYDVGIEESRATGLPQGPMCAFERHVTAALDALKPQHKRRVGRACGPEDNRIFGMSDPGYRAQLERARTGELQRQEAAAEAHYTSAFAHFVRGAKSFEGVTKESEDASLCIRKLTKLLKDKQKGVCAVVAVQGWSDELLGKAAVAAMKAKAIQGTAFLGECCSVDAQMAKSRKAVCVAHNWLRRVYPDRFARCPRADNTRAREYLQDELRRAGKGRVVVLIDGSALPLQEHDWYECFCVSAKCNAAVVVTVHCQDAAPRDGVHFIGPPAGARPRAHLAQVQREAAAVEAAAAAAVAESHKRKREEILAESEDEWVSCTEGEEESEDEL